MDGPDEKVVREWLSKVLQDELLSEDTISLGDLLSSGDVLCQVANLLIPNSIMENALSPSSSSKQTVCLLFPSLLFLFASSSLLKRSSIFCFSH